MQKAGNWSLAIILFTRGIHGRPDCRGKLEYRAGGSDEIFKLSLAINMYLIYF